MKDYIFFIPPLEIAEKKPKEWTAKEARLYFDWLMSVKDDRVDYLLTCLDEVLTDNSLVDIERIGKKVTKLLFEPPFSDRENDVSTITNKGLALVADMALLISQLVIKDCPQITWKIVKRPKTNGAYNLPALFEIPLIKHIEMIGAAITNAKAILRNEKTFSTWVKMYEHSIGYINGEVPR